MSNRQFTAESVCIGYLDKLCDLIADQILDDALFEDKNARTAIEVMIKNASSTPQQTPSTKSSLLKPIPNKASKTCPHHPRS